MKKRYKFKGKRIDNNQWIIGYYVLDADNCARIYFFEKGIGYYYFVENLSVELLEENRNAKNGWLIIIAFIVWLIVLILFYVP